MEALEVCTCCTAQLVTLCGEYEPRDRHQQRMPIEHLSRIQTEPATVRQQPNEHEQRTTHAAGVRHECSCALRVNRARHEAGRGGDEV